MNKPQPPRTAPPAHVARSEGGTREGAPARRQVRTAQRPDTVPETGERVARAWARHPIVSMVRHRQRLSFYQGLHGMLRAGMPLNVAFTDLSRGAANDPFRYAVAKVGEAVSAGAGLAEAMRRYPAWFEPQVVELLEVAELSGTLEGALERIIEWMREAQRLRWRTVSLGLYPAYLLLAFTLGGAVLDAVGALKGSGSLASLPTAIFFAFARRFLQAAGVGLAVFAAPLAMAALGLEERWERLRLRLPLLGRFHRASRAGRFCQLLGASLGAGLDAGRSLQMALEATGSAELRVRAGMAVQRLRDGAGLTEVVEWLGILDGESLRRVATGERTGHLAPVLHQMAREHSEASLRWLQALVLAIIAAMVVFLFATSIGRIFEFQGSYYRQLEKLGEGS